MVVFAKGFFPAEDPSSAKLGSLSRNWVKVHPAQAPKVRLRLMRHCRVAPTALVQAAKSPTGSEQHGKPDAGSPVKGAGMAEPDQNPEDSALALPVKVPKRPSLE